MQFGICHRERIGIGHTPLWHFVCISPTTTPNCDELEHQTYFLIDYKLVKLLTFHSEKIVNEHCTGDASKCYEIASHCTLFTHVIWLAFMQTSELAVCLPFSGG